jgi:hypothetical protein
MADGAYGAGFALIIVLFTSYHRWSSLVLKDSNNGWRCAKHHTCPIHYFVNT